MCISVHVCACIYEMLCVCFFGVCVCVCVSVYVCVFVWYLCLCMCVCVSLYEREYSVLSLSSLLLIPLLLSACHIQYLIHHSIFTLCLSVVVVVFFCLFPFFFCFFLECLYFQHIRRMTLYTSMIVAVDCNGEASRYEKCYTGKRKSNNEM